MRWRTIPGFSHYEVSEDGAVRRHSKLHVKKPGHRLAPGKLLSPGIRKDGRRCYRLVRDDGTLKSMFASRCVALAFIGPRPSNEHFVLHRNDDHTNDYFRNLYWGTIQENTDDAFRNGGRKRPPPRQPKVRKPKYCFEGVGA